MVRDHLTWLEHDDLKNSFSMPLHVVCLDTLLNLEGLKAEVSLDEQETCVLHNFNLVDSLFNELLAEELVLLIDIDDKDVAFLVGSVQLLLLIVPAQTREYSLVRIGKLVMSCPFSFSCFEPLQSLIVTDRENQVLLHDEKDLDHANPMD